MRVVFRQSGGFAGLILGTELNTNDLPPEEAATLRSLVQQGNLQSPIGETASRARDLRTYEIIVEPDEGDSYHVAFDDSNVPRGVGPLLDMLRERARPRPLT
jgi:emfourin